MADLVSIIVPTYNREYCVGKTIDSALAQTHRNLEIMVADDGSTDNTRDLIEQTARADNQQQRHQSAEDDHAVAGEYSD